MARTVGWYAEVPEVRSRQVAADAAWLLATALSVLLGRTVFRVLDAVASPVRSLAGGADDLREQLDAAGARAADVPLAGRALSAPLTDAADGAASLAGAATAQAQQISHVALAVGLAVAALLLGFATWRWARWRRRGWARVRTALSWSTREGGQDWLALQALQNAGPDRLQTVAADPVDGWRRRDPDVVRALADLHLRTVGIAAGPGTVRMGS